MSWDLDNNTTTIGVFASHLQGEFVGEVANQIRQHCVLRGYKYIGFCTGQDVKYHCTLSLEQLDCAIIIRDCVSHEFAKELVERKIATVSVAYDYFPVDIPIVSSDNARGTELAFQYLLEQGHETISFAGDLRNFDVRKRYERFCELSEAHEMGFGEDLLIPVSNNEIGGGLEAGDAFIERGCNSTAVFCAAGFVAIGFLRRLQKNKIQLSDSLEVVGYEAMPIIPVLAPGISLIDQNVHLIAYKAVSVVCDLLSGKEMAREQKVEPKLISRLQEVETDNNLILATSVDLPEIFNSGYMSSILNNNFIWNDQIADSGLEKLMNIAPLFEKFMGLATFSKISPAREGEKDITLLKIFSLEKTDKVSPKSSIAKCKLSHFPDEAFSQSHLSVFDNMTHFFIRANGRISGVISIYGDSASKTQLASYLYLCGQISSVAKVMGLNIEKRLAASISLAGDKTADKPKADVNVVRHPVDWNIGKNETTWSEGALSLLGLVSPIDINIYKHMDFGDRIASEDADKIRTKTAESVTSKEGFSDTCKIKSKDGSYVSFSVVAEPKEVTQDEISVLRFYIHQIVED
ncbi:MAG: substrate-binding domain-containing protein [Agarilytica sp.]